MVNAKSPRFFSRKKSTRIKSTAGERVFDIFNISFLFLLMLVMLYPFYDVIIRSFASSIRYLGPLAWPRQWSFEAYRMLGQYQEMWAAYGTTALRSIIATSLHLLVCAMAAFALSKKWLPLNGLLTKLMLFTMLFGGGMIPTYLMYRDMGLLNTFSVLVLPNLVSAYNILIIRNFYQSIPASLEESAQLDGAGWITVWSRIILPLCKPVLATVALWMLMGIWNDWFAPSVYVNSGKYKVIQQILRKFVIENDPSNIENALRGIDKRYDQFSGRQLQSATILAASVPILMIYPFIQKYFTKGIMIGAVKG